MILYDFQVRRSTLILSIVFSVLVGVLYSQTVPGPDDIDLLVSRLDLPGSIIDETSSSKINAEKILQYYKERINIKHLVPRTADVTQIDVKVTDTDRNRANDAVKHILIGQPAYSPSDRGPDIDWHSNPVADKEWIWQLHRMYFWTSMGKMYAATRDEKYAESWANQIIDWIAKNPNDSLHEYAWRSIEAGIRGYSWTALFQYFIDSRFFDERVMVPFLNSCFEHAQHLMNHYSTGSNWALMEAEGLAFIAITFPEFKASGQWLSSALERLNREITIQVNSDGHQRELAMGYHIGCIRWFLRTYRLASLNGHQGAFAENYLSTLENMCAVPMKIGLPDGTNVQFGDAWAGSPGQHRERFSEWAALFNREDFLYIATNGNEGKPPEETAYALPSSGIYSMRSGWDKDAICLVLKCGPDGGYHCQRDNGTFDLYAGGRNFMPDAGSYIYSGDPEQRNWFRQTSVHQTLTLNQQNSDYAPDLRLWKTSPNLDLLVVENRSYPDLTHRRSVLFIDKKYFVIIDEAMGEAVGDLKVHFQLAPGPSYIDTSTLTASTNYVDGWNLKVLGQSQSGLSLEEEKGQVSFIYTQKEPRPAFCYKKRKSSSSEIVRFVTVVTPYEVSPIQDIEVEVLTKPGSDKISVLLASQADRRKIDFELDTNDGGH